MCKTCTGEIRVRHTKICAYACWSGQLSRDAFFGSSLLDYRAFYLTLLA